MPALPNYITPPLSINVSVDTMEERLSITKTSVSADSEDRLIAIHRPVGSEGEHHTDLIGYRQSQGENRIVNHLVHFYMDSASPSGWAHTETELPEMYDPTSAEKTLSGIKALSGFHQNGITYVFVAYQSPVAEHSAIVQIMWCVIKDGKPVWSDKKWTHKGDDSRTVLSSVRQLCIHRRQDGNHVLYGVTHGYGEPEKGRGNEQFFMLDTLPPAEPGNIVNEDIAFNTYHDSKHEAPGWSGVEQAATYQLATPLTGESDNLRYTLLRLRDGGLEFHTAISIPEDDLHDIPRLGFETGANTVEIPGLNLHGARIFDVPAGPKDALLVHKKDGELGLIQGYRSATPSYLSLIGKGDGPESVGRICTGVIGLLDSAGSKFAIYATDSETKQLWVLRLADDPEDYLWTCLGDQVAEMVCPRVMPNGEELFTLAPKATTIQYKSQNLATTSWSQIPLSVATAVSENITPISAHVFDIEVLDANEVPSVDQKISLTADAPCLFYVDGVAHRVGPRLPVVMETNHMGRIRGVIRAGGLKAPTLHADTSGLERVPIQPNGRITERLAGNAKGFNVSKDISALAPPEHQRQVGELIRSFGHASSKAKRGAHCDGSVRSSYSMALADDGAAFEAITPRKFHAKHVTGGNPFTLIGDFFNFIGNAFSRIKELVVNVLDAGVEFIVNIGKQVWKFTTKVFDSIIDGFEALGKFLARVFEKLGTVIKNIGQKILQAVCFIFDGKDVFAANDAIQATVRAFFRTASLTAAKFGKKVNKAYQDKIDELDALVDKFIDPATDVDKHRQDMNSQGFRVGKLDIPAPKALAHNNRAGSDIMGNASGSLRKNDTIQPSSLPKNELEAISNFLKKLHNNYKQDMESPFNDLVERFRQEDDLLDKLQDSPIMILKLVKGIIKTLAKMAGDLLELALDLVRLLVDRIFEMLDEAINIPFVTTLVRLWSGDASRNLTFFDLITLPIAFVGTALWKIVSGRAIVTPDQARPFCDWANQRPAPLDILGLSENKGSSSIPQPRSVGAAAADELRNTVNNNLLTHDILVVFAKLTIIVAMGGILFQALQVIDLEWSIHSIPTTSSWKALMLIAGLLPIILSTFSFLTQYYFEVFTRKIFPSGKYLPDEEVAARVECTFHVLSVVCVMAVFMILLLIKLKDEIGELIKGIIEGIDFIFTSILLIIIYIGLIVYYIYTIVKESGELNDKETHGLHVAGIGIASASIVATLINIGGRIVALIAHVMGKSPEPTTLTISILVGGCGVFLISMGAILSKTSTIVKAGINYSHYENWKEA